jgi:hypothetical protein
MAKGLAPRNLYIIPTAFGTRSNLTSIGSFSKAILPTLIDLILTIQNGGM